VPVVCDLMKRTAREWIVVRMRIIARKELALLECNTPAKESPTEAQLKEAAVRFLTPRPPRTKPRDAELLRRGTPLTLDCGLAATAWGDGPTVLLAHGWESQRTHWGAFVSPLVEAGFRAVAVDAPAHGESPGQMTNVVEYARALVQIGLQIGPLAGVLAHSFGAGATPIALHRGLEANRAVLISGPSSLASVVERWGRHHGIAEEEIPRFIQQVENEIGEPMADLDLPHTVAGLSTPALIVHDRNDKEIPVEDGLALAAAWPGARTLITQSYGHRRIMIAPEVVSAILAYLTERESP
jgi:pimeloyl-ACP methyl ester carboxylesterase